VRHRSWLDSLGTIHLGNNTTTQQQHPSSPFDFNMRFNFKLATAVAVLLGLGSTQEATRQIAIVGSSPMAALRLFTVSPLR
jgi:hypothetical protein